MTERDVQELRRTLAQRQQEKAELEHQVRSFLSQFQSEIAPLQEEVLRLQVERLKEAAQHRMRSARLRNAYHDAQEAYERFRERRDREEPPRIASPDEDLKATYRRALKLCHPDVVPDSYHEEASATFRALESSYEANQEAAVRAIAEGLEKWGFPRPPSAPTESSGAADRTTLRRAVSDLDTSIQQLRGSEVYQTLSEPTDLDVESVVGARKRELQRQLQELQRQQRSRI